MCGKNYCGGEGYLAAIDVRIDIYSVVQTHAAAADNRVEYCVRRNDNDDDDDDVFTTHTHTHVCTTLTEYNIRNIVALRRKIFYTFIIILSFQTIIRTRRTDEPLGVAREWKIYRSCVGTTPPSHVSTDRHAGANIVL